MENIFSVLRGVGIPTPFYAYDLDMVESRALKFRKSFTGPVRLHFAMKTNHFPACLKIFRRLGYGVDVVSGGEWKEAETRAGFTAQEVIFSGVAKTRLELERAIKENIYQINVESIPELLRISKIVWEQSREVALALRINPNVDAKTHKHITTGLSENKFGLPSEQLPEALAIVKKNPLLRLKGIAMHIGSQILELSSFGEALDKALPVALDIRAQGFPIERFDVGGGVGIDYTGNGSEPSWTEYASILEKRIRPTGFEILLEPGRCIIGPCGFLVADVEYVKDVPGKRFVIVNTGMHQLLRPALYEAFHRIEALSPRSGVQSVADVVGPICESTDILGKSRTFGPLEEGDRLVIRDVGAYGAVMASHYNGYDLPTEIGVLGGQIVLS